MQRFSTFFLLIFLNINNFAFAQFLNEGIYLSTADFNRGRISYPKIQGKKYKLILHELVNTSKLKVIIGDSTIILKKDSIFGYQDKNNKAYRFYKNTKYLILNPKEKLLLYSTNFLGGPKNNQMVTNYFFSTDSNSPINKLTKSNLKTVFLSDTAFYELLDIYFNSDKALIEYDKYLKTYKLNKIEKLNNNSKINTQKQ